MENHSTHRRRLSQRIRQFAEHLFSAPFQTLPSAFGDQTPPEFKVLQAEAEGARHDVVETPGMPEVHIRSSKAMRPK
jgi:hypothetical protein